MKTLMAALNATAVVALGACVLGGLVYCSIYYPKAFVLSFVGLAFSGVWYALFLAYKQ